MQPANECVCTDILSAIGNLDKLALEVTDVGLESITLPHLNEEEMMVILLGLPTRGVLSEKCFGYLLEVVERMKRQRVEPIQDHAFQVGRKD